MPKNSKTKFYNSVARPWVVVDAKGATLGRLASRVSRILQGKQKPVYSPNFLCGDKVIIINAKDIRVSGDKYQTKIYDKYTGYPSGRKVMPLKELAAKNSPKVLRLAIKGMLPKTWLGKRMLRSLRIYEQESHLHSAQQPQGVLIK
ncbi:MAG: 50S ribosomal protein L13 [Candidatus Omnitrophota bacterium]